MADYFINNFLNSVSNYPNSIAIEDGEYKFTYKKLFEDAVLLPPPNTTYSNAISIDDKTLMS